MPFKITKKKKITKIIERFLKMKAGNIHKANLLGQLLFQEKCRVKMEIKLKKDNKNNQENDLMIFSSFYIVYF